MTNLEWIKTLDKEQMTELIDKINSCGFCSENDKKTGVCDGKCKRHASEWLKAEKQIKIKDCPFCGSTAILKKMAVGEVFYVGCDNQIQCGNRTRGQKTEEEAIEKWNRRIL